MRMNGRSRRRHGRQNGSCQRTGRKDKRKILAARERPTVDPGTARPIEKMGTEAGISGDTGMDSGKMGNSSASGNSSVNDNLGSDMSGGEDEPLSDL